jgi:hypothetical protein
MPRITARPTPDIVSHVKAAVASSGLRTVALSTGVHHSALTRVIEGAPVSPDTLVKLGRIAPRVRSSSEFITARASGVAPPVTKQGHFAWDLETIRTARDAQMLGKFALPVRLAEASRTDDAIFTAYHNRIAPLSCIETKLVPAEGARGAAAARKAASSIFVSRDVLAGIDGTLANHGLAVGYVEQETNDEGTIVDFRLTEWPLEFVEYDSSRECLWTRTRDASRVDIVHGDSRWIAFRKFKTKPWTQEACILPAAMVWGAHGNGIADWAGASRSHGLAQIMGELPEGVSLFDEAGNPTPEAQAFLAMMQRLVSGDAGAGIKPAGSKTEFLASSSTAWQVFSELIMNREKAAARIYLGTDAMLGSVGGAPGVDIATLFGVATTKVQGDIEALETGLRTGLYEPWAAINEGSSRYAPSLKYQMPDPDLDAKRAERAACRARLNATVSEMRAAGLVVTQADVNAMAIEFSVSPVPQLPAAPTEPTTVAP